MKITCIQCNNTFETKNKTRKFCSISCSGKYNGKHGLVGGNKSDLNSLIKLYGVLDGNLRYQNKLDKLSKSNKGRVSPMFGKHWNESQKLRISKSVKASEYHNSIRGIPISDEKKDLLSKKLKGTFTLNWFINKYGDADGSKRYNERCNNLVYKSTFKIYNKTNKNNFSKISQNLFWDLYNDDTLILKQKLVYFGELNHEYGCETNTNFDFVVKDDKKIIEFNGDIWHGNPVLYKIDDTPNPYNKNITTSDIWDTDNKKLERARNNGYDILIVWEKEYIENREEVTKICKTFLTTQN